MTLTRRSTRLLLIGAAVAVGVIVVCGGLVGFDSLRGASGTVTIGTSLGAPAGDGSPTLRLGDPFRAVLALDRRLGSDARVDFELHRIEGETERQRLVYTIASSAERDEIYVAWKRTAQLVKDEPGRYRVRFAQAGRPLGEALFVVVP